MSENKYSLICSTFTGTLNQLHFILFIHLSSHFIFQFLHVVLMEYACLLAIRKIKKDEENIIRERIADALLNDHDRNFLSGSKRIRSNKTGNCRIVDGQTDAGMLYCSREIS